MLPVDLLGRKISNRGHMCTCNWYTLLHSRNLTAESEGELKSHLIKLKEESEKVGLKLNIHKMKIMASGHITSWGNSGNSVRLFLGAPKSHADGDCSHEIKRRLLLGRKVMTNLESIVKKQRHYFANKGPSSQGYGLSSGHVWM